MNSSVFNHSSTAQPCEPIPNHIFRKAGSVVQERISTLKIGQKMQDLPEHLWHDSFKYYVKEDPNRRGGPNMRMIRLDPGRPSLTVTGYIFNKFVHPFEDRFISVREAARLQGFPDDLEFQGSLTSTQQQIGNAVPVPLAEAVFQSILRANDTGPSSKMEMSALSLFCGAGGLDLGASLTGRISVLASLDIWEDACQSLADYKHHKGKVLIQDIASVSDPLGYWRSITGVHERPYIVFGGPPCQSFSQAGKQGGISDSRGGLIFEFVRWIEALRPEYFLMENVSNLRGVHGGKVFDAIQSEMAKLGYLVISKVLLAADYGAPQLRSRLFFIGSRRANDRLRFQDPTYSAESGLFSLPLHRTVGEAFENLPRLI